MRLALFSVLLATMAAMAAIPAGAQDGPTSLVIRVYPDGLAKKATARTWTLRCNPPRGSLPARASACRRLLSLKLPFRPTPPNTACTAIYGGPAVAFVAGTLRGRAVASWFNRRNGCAIARWERVRFLLRH